MAYRFYGWETASVTDRTGRTPCAYYDLLSRAWCAETCAPRMRDRWTPENRTLGQCSITAFLMQDLFGGEVRGVPLGDGNYHCFNVVGDCVFDLTSEQFGETKLCYENCPVQDRAVHFQKAEKHARYRLLRARLAAALDAQDNATLIDHWSRAFSETAGETPAAADVPDWKTIAPSEKLLRAAASLGGCQRALDYGCGSAWAAIIAAKSGCPDVTAADAAPGAITAAKARAALYGVQNCVHPVCVALNWLETIPANTYDGLICSNVLDVVPPQTAADMLRAFVEITTPDATVVIGLNFYLSPEAAAQRGVMLADGSRLYQNGVLRLVSRTDEAWAAQFAPYFTVERLEHFAWPGEPRETRRLFYLRKGKG